MSTLKQLLGRKQIETLLAEMAGEHRLQRVLGPVALTALGIGSVIGAGIFVTTGRAAAQDAGPAIVLSFMVAAIGCGLAGLCYAEFASATPVAGSAYTYAYATLGEMLAWIIGWDLILEYAMACATVASAWSGYLNELLAALGWWEVPARFASHPWRFIETADGPVRPFFNLPAILMVAGCTAVLVRGIRESATTNAALVILKLFVVLFVIGMGWRYVDSRNWTQIPIDQRLQADDPTAASHAPNAEVKGAGVRAFLKPVDDRVRSPFMPYGVSGIMLGASIVFFAFIGFDAISTHSEEAKRPQRDVPLAILTTLVICTALYVAVALVITGMVPYPKIDVSAPLAAAFGDRARAEDSFVLRAATAVIAAGGLAGMTSVVLVTFLSQARIFLAMARDGLLPPVFSAVHPRFQTPYLATMMTGVAIALAAGLTPIERLEEMVNIGTLLAFVVVCFSVLILRVQRPDAERPFRCPAVWFVAPAGILANVAMMLFLPAHTWWRLVVWLGLGLVFYFSYGFRHSVAGHALWRQLAEQGVSPTDAPLDSK